MKLLSVIIPYFNTLENTKKLLESLINQKTDDVEIILVDDGCYEEYFKKHQIKLFQIQNAGVSVARNVGLENAEGNYITFVDSDDMVTDHYIGTILVAIKTKEFDYCYFGWESTRGDMRVTGDPPSWNTSVWNCIYKRDRIGDIRFNENKQIGEDGEFNLLVRKGEKEQINEILYIYDNQRQDSLTRKYCKGEIKMIKELNGKIVVYRSFLSMIGGIESAIYNLCKTLGSKYDITFIYDTADQMQLFRLRKLVRCVKYDNQQINCDKFIFYGFNPTKILDTVTAKDIIQQICCDVEAVNFRQKIHPRVTQVFADSLASKKTFQKIHNPIKCGVLHNIFIKSEHKRVLNLMTASRLSWEKGYDRMKKMAKRMHELNIPFTWEVFTNDKPNENIDGLIFRESCLNVLDYMSNKDYGVQLSETESWCCTASEFLLAGIPMILTDFPSATEQVQDGVNGYILKRDLSNLDLVIQKMYETKLVGFDYQILSEEEWRKVLGQKSKSDYKYNLADVIMMKSKMNYYDTVLGKHVSAGEIFEATLDRAKVLTGDNPQRIRFGEIMK